MLPLVFSEKNVSLMPMPMNPESSKQNSSTAFWRRPEVLFVLLAFALRIGFMLADHTYRFPAVKNHFAFGYETGSIAGAIARGEGFSSPFAEPTGPTAWIGPVYPYMLAGIFKVFGLFSDASAIAIFSVNSLFAALTCWTMFQIGNEVFGKRVALLASGLWAVVPFFFRYAITWVWDPPVSAFLLSVGVLLVIRIKSTGWKEWAGMGALAGFSALVNPALTTLFPVLFAWAVWKLWRRRIHAWKSAAVALLVMFVCISPWLLRNRVVFGQWVFLRSNAGFEFSLGNFPGSPGVAFKGMHPAVNRRIFEQYKSMGEIAFCKLKGDEAVAWARSHPEDFIKLSLKRVADFWDGRELMHEPPSDPWRPWMVSLESAPALLGFLLIAVRRIPNSAPIGLMFLIYPLPYYVVYTNPRYRHAIEPLMVVLIAYFVVTVWEEVRATGKAKKKEPAAAIGVR